MCWVTLNKENIRFRHAIEDIPVYKVVKKSLLSYYENYSYILNEVRVTELDNPSHTKYLSGAEDWKIRSGFHSYSMNCKVNLVNGQTSLFVRILKLHDDLVAIDCYERDATCMLDCLIPKGSLYYVNELGEYVSESILPLKIETW